MHKKWSWIIPRKLSSHHFKDFWITSTTLHNRITLDIWIFFIKLCYKNFWFLGSSVKSVNILKILQLKYITIEAEYYVPFRNLKFRFKFFFYTCAVNYDILTHRRALKIFFVHVKDFLKASEKKTFNVCHQFE